MKDDATLLRQYAGKGDESAFAELVRRHVDMVYGAALRRTGGNVHLAADISQQVFTTLARRARSLARHPVLSAWLHTATRNAALNLMISEQRRKARETAAALQSREETGGVDPDWSRVKPWLDAAIDELSAPDRAAVVLRYLQHLRFAEIGAALSVSEDAARVRTDRALDKLRVALARRGIKSTASALGLAMAGQPAISAPAGLAATIATQALAVSGVGLFAAVALFMTPKLVTTAVISALIAFGVGAFVGHHRGPVASAPGMPASIRPSPELQTLQAENVRLQSDLDLLRSERDRLMNASAVMVAQPATMAAAPARSPTIGMSRGDIQRAVLNNLRQVKAARDQYNLERGRAPNSVHDLVGTGAYIRTLRTVGGEDYAAVSMEPNSPLTVTTPDGIEVTFDPSGVNTTQPEKTPEEQRLEALAAPLMAKLKIPTDRALEAYRAANNGANPSNAQALVPYFSTVEEGADFVELLELEKAAKR